MHKTPNKNVVLCELIKETGNHQTPMFKDWPDSKVKGADQ